MTADGLRPGPSAVDRRYSCCVPRGRDEKQMNESDCCETEHGTDYGSRSGRDEYGMHVDELLKDS
jgi:hypothetical protein